MSCSSPGRNPRNTGRERRVTSFFVFVFWRVCGENLLCSMSSICVTVEWNCGLSGTEATRRLLGPTPPTATVRPGTAAACYWLRTEGNAHRLISTCRVGQAHPGPTQVTVC
ncbi:hypothetical protein AAFF_G00038960 [Aldrovandia affinis]|uniref:Uncharacterized protein n=1 Tax=Aldrovandia affinis TaxID=143900 RepID=A0AAD7T5A1_9TELE|nr:hypothetical protein AAFF_G00038960 [Aldrovandia affinis]